MILKPILSQALNPITRSISGVISRFFTTFDRVAQSYISFDNVPLSGDFTIEFDYAGSDGDAHFLGENGADPNRSFIYINDWYVDGLNVNLGSATTILNGNLNRLKIVRVSGVVTGYVNGVENGSGSTTRTLSFGRIGGWFQNDFTDGVISNVKIIDNGTLVLDMPIDQNYTPTNNTVIDRASGNNGTFINVADGDSTFYQLINGQWVDGSGNVLEIA